MNRPIQAWLSAVSGACALCTVLLWYWLSWDGGLSIPSPPGGDMLEVSSLFGMAMLGVAFQFGTPALNVPAWILGYRARTHAAAKTGMALAALSLLLYAYYLWFIFDFVQGDLRAAT